MKILAIETSTAACSVALNINGAIKEEFVLLPREHHQILLPMIEKLLVQANLTVSQLDAISFGCGPGSFTGVRMAAGVTQGLAVSYDIPVIPISSLQILAQSTFRLEKMEKIICCVDARMQEIYWAYYELNKAKKIMELTGEENCTAADALIITDKSWSGVGNGWESYTTMREKSQQLQKLNPTIYPHAEDLAFLAAASNIKLTPEQALPRYLQQINYKKSNL